RHGEPLPLDKLAERPPSIKRQERMIRRRLDFLSGSESKTEDLLPPADEDVRHRIRLILEPLIQSPHRNISGVGGEQLAQRHFSVGVSTNYSCRRGQAPTLP